MLKQHGGDMLQSPQLDTLLLINDQLAGNPGQHALTKICLPPQEEKEALVFQTSYSYPEHSFTYAFITVSRWSANRENREAFLKKVGIIELPMVRSQEPKLETLSETQAASLLGVDNCSTKAAKYTIIGTPRCHTSEYTPIAPRGPIREGLDKVASIIDGNTKLKIELVHPIYEETNNSSPDPTVEILENCTAGWHRDANNPFSIYFANSSYERMLDLSMVPKGKDIPYMGQLPALAVFDSKKQYYVAMAIGNQQEKEYHDRQHAKLLKFELAARFIPDPQSLHPKSKAPQEYFMLIDASSLGPDIDYLLPRIGDSAEVVPKGISTKRQESTEDVKDADDVDNDHIVSHIKNSYEDVLGDNSIESKSALIDKFQDMLKILCVKDESGNNIAAHLEKLESNIDTMKHMARNDEELSEFVRANRTWLTPPALGTDEVNPSGDPVCLHGHRINVPSKLWSVQTHVWKLQVPIDKETTKLPLILNLPDPSADDAGNPLETIETFTERLEMSDKYVNVKMKIIDNDETYEAEMNALNKLLAPRMMPEDDRPSLASINAVEDLITANLRDGQALKEFMTDLEKLRQGIHKNQKLQYFYKRLSKDKHEAIQYLLDDKKLIKYIHGPPGTGKSYLALWIVCIALMFDPPTTGTDDEWDRPIDLGPQIKPRDYDNVDLSVPVRTMQLTDEQKAAHRSAPPRTKILIVSGQNTAVDDLLPRLLPLWKDIGGPKVRKQKPVVLRLYSWESEYRDFFRRFAQVGRHSQRTTEDTTEGALMRLLGAFSDQADEFGQEGRKTRSSNPSVADKAVELFNADRVAPAGRKYEVLCLLISQLAACPDQKYLIGRKITRLIKEGPLTDALKQADVIFSTPIGAADKTFRQTFRPHYIISDESPRDKEITFLTLLAHFSPRAYLCFGEHKELCPVIFSTHQHRKYKPQRSFEQAGIEHTSGVEPKDSDTQDEPKERAIKDAQKKQEDNLPNPSIFAHQMESSIIHRLVQAGHPSYMLTHNFRQHGIVGEFFNRQFYQGKIKFREANGQLGTMDEAAVSWLRQLSGKDQAKVKGNTLMINMNSSESSEARSFRNFGNVNYVLEKVVELLADPEFSTSAKNRNDGKVMIVAPYEAQRSLYTHELQRRGNWEMGSKGNWVPFDKSRIEIRTHQGAQGHEASVVIIDLTRSNAPGMTGQSQLIRVCSSRSICAQLVLINTSMLERVEFKNSPAVRNLAAWVQFHQEKDMLIDMDTETAKQYRIVCFKCYAIGHKGSECPSMMGKPLICPNCEGEHHPRDCDMAKSIDVPVKTTKKAKKRAKTSPPVETTPTTRRARNQ